MARRPEMSERDIRETQADCRRAAWADPTPDWLRVPLWSACDAMRQLRRENAALRERLARQAAVLERAELDLEQMRRAMYGGQRGGAA